jgi:hypothetical protein
MGLKILVSLVRFPVAPRRKTTTYSDVGGFIFVLSVAVLRWFEALS